MSYHCECEQCKNKEFNPEDYLIKEEDFKILDKERPLGISGHLRVKDEAMSVAECIDSCIDALDELVITYNKSIDNTEEILKKYEKKYPDKIRLYYYEPYLMKYNEDEYIKKYSELHYFHYYSNFGFTKIKYKYYIKIDADQIYFREKLLEVREVLLSDISENNLSTKIKYLLFINKLVWFIPFKFLRQKVRSFYLGKKFNKSKSYVYERIDELLNIRDIIIYAKFVHNDNLVLELGGFNVYLFENKLYIYHDIPFNGCIGDHAIYVAKSDNKYFLNDDTKLENNRISYIDFRICFFWIHFHCIKRNYQINRIENFVDIINIDKKSWDDINEVMVKDGLYMNKVYCLFGKYFFDTDKKYVTKDFYDRYLKNPIEYTIKNKFKSIKRLW